jgi:hypothetical protein
MSAPRPPLPKEGQQQKPRVPGNQPNTTQVANAPRRPGPTSQSGSPAVRSNVTSVALTFRPGDKINSPANKQNVASPIPGRKIYSKRKSLIFYLHIYI